MEDPLFYKEDGKEIDLGKRGDREELGGVESREAMARMYCMRDEFISEEEKEEGKRRKRSRGKMRK